MLKKTQEGARQTKLHCPHSTRVVSSVTSVFLVSSQLFHTHLLVQVRWTCVCRCPFVHPSIHPSIKSSSCLDKVHVSLSPELSGLSHKPLQLGRLMALLISHLETANSRACRQTDLSHTPEEIKLSFLLF